MIKTLAAQHYAPIFVIKYFEIMNASCLNEMLNPSVPIDSAASGPIKFVVFEDFDRFMATARGKGFISQLLNSMDGLYDTPGVFRFFTGNGVEELLKEPALMNRISGVMMFHLPTQDMFVAQLVKLFSVVTPAYVPESSKLTAIANAAGMMLYARTGLHMCKHIVLCAVSVKASLRPFTTFAVRYIFERDPLEAMLRNIEHLNGWLSSSAGTVAASTTIHNNEDYVVEEVIVN